MALPTALERYLTEINATFEAPFTSRLDEAVSVAARLCPETLDTFFLSDVINDEGVKTFTSLWAFSERYLMEAKSIFSLTLDLDMVIDMGSITYLAVKASHYNFEKGDDTSRLTVQLQCGSVSAVLHATQTNCDVLWGLASNRFRHRLEVHVPTGRDSLRS